MVTAIGRYAEKRSVPVKTSFHPGSTIPKLNFLRAVCAALVVFHHSGYTHLPAAWGMFIFFFMSGFLITRLLLKENEVSGAISLRNFYARRGLHILPPLYVYCIIAVIALATPLYHLRISWWEVVCCVLCVPNYYLGLHGHPYTLFSHTWFLGVEEQFYILWPCFFTLFRRHLKALATILLFVIPALWIYRAFLGFSHVSDAYIYTSFETRADAILLGCWVALCIHNRLAERFLHHVSRPRYLMLTLPAIAWSLWISEHLSHPKLELFSFTIDPLLASALILQLITLNGGRWMDNRIFSFLGKISYSTYIYQQLVIPVVRHLVPHSPHIVFSILALFCAWGVATASYNLIEKPLLRMKDRFFPPHRLLQVSSVNHIPNAAAGQA